MGPLQLIFLLKWKGKKMRIYEFDVMVIGCGISGLASAIKLAESGVKVGVITRELDPLISNTYFAQGGIIYSGEEDKKLVSDILRASANTSYNEAAQELSSKSGKILNEMLLDKANTDFSRDENGNLNFTMEAAHSHSRILYKGDFTGREIQASLLNYLKDKKRFPNVFIKEAHTAIDLLTPNHHGVSLNQRYEEDKVVGSYLLDQRNKEVVKAMAKVTILATGGIGSLYLHHSNSDGARGDGHAMAKRAGALLTNMEFIQFHPTTFFDGSSHRRFLVSEAVRGEGGILLNSEGVAFMGKYHEDKELAPRDVVARAIVDECIETKNEFVYLDISHKDSEWIKERFPTIYEHCLSKNIDMTKEPIPVVPASHYTCGGVKTDLKGQTNLKNLYAVGELACTGLHGANRLASTSLAEGLTFGYLAAENIKKNLAELDQYPDDLIRDWEIEERESDMALINQDWLTLRQTMWNYAGLTRTSARLGRAEAMLRELYDEIQTFYKNTSLNDNLIGLRNAVEIGFLVIKSSQRNKESVGCFYRTS